MDFATRRLGSSYLEDGQCRFLVWAPRAEQVEVRLVAPRPRLLPLAPAGGGYFRALIDDCEPGALYFYRLDGYKERPDPASRFQPEGVHGPSQVVDPHFAWDDGHWRGLPLQDYVLYELHVGAFSAEGTFDAVVPHLDDLKDLGVTAIELMPVAQFPGERNWGYDGAYLFAVQNSYGGPDGLRRLINACHRRGLAVALDVVYNHLGPEGNYLADFGHYFTQRYRTPWGSAVNFDGPYSDDVRRFFIENALFWVRDFHIDALRLDAIHAIFDESARPFLKELAAAVHGEAERLNRRIYTVAESNKNDARHIQPVEIGGYNLDAQWNDDFHHSLHVLLTGERVGYYKDFSSLADLGQAVREGFVYCGQYSHYRGRRHGVSSHSIPAAKFVVFSQNHDQVGNRLCSERLSQLVSFEQLKLAAGLVLLAPYVPLLFMGEEYGETAPFFYFVSHTEAALNEAVRRGRQAEFTAFAWEGEIPDPQAEDTFRRSLLNHELRRQTRHQTLWRFYQALLRLRKNTPALSLLSKQRLHVAALEKQQTLCLRRANGDSQAYGVFHFGAEAASVALPWSEGKWEKAFDSADPQWLGTGGAAAERLHSPGQVVLDLPPTAFVLFLREQV